MPIRIHIDEPAEFDLIIERDTTPKLDFEIYEDEDATVEVDVDDVTFEAYIKAKFETDNDEAAITWLDGDVVRKPGGADNVVRFPITLAQSNNATQLLDQGVLVVYMTDGAGHRERIVKADVEARS